ncbi:GntR family transcriptional regulator [Pseudobacteriovorax antillogorgiicola]|uniref:GntR family transcriptional regulator n=1 Tax=Pseudobacteriovorax antillogorgiicola TaxID=1513793 RepID=A0A1Y6CE82_9BACT|nr:GntR family transcriptional regulator [Pseudobacteriovorax antillogorgiicola]TCS47686.1 GntR family transcriptional regulator [Pseudobacteriovorax antillogorgiicola]SMF59537.1 GntR family transcriptional regulator [Pseudobacteriovorax antillogorgiicola]
MWIIDHKSGPVYKQLADQVVAKLASGEMKPGDRLPSTRDLARDAMVNPNTVVSAYNELEARKIIEKRRGLGSYIRDDADVGRLRLNLLVKYSNDFLRKVESLGLTAEQAVMQLKNMRNL